MSLPPGPLQTHRKTLWSSCVGHNRRLRPQPCWSHSPGCDEGETPPGPPTSGREDARSPGKTMTAWSGYLLFQLLPQKSILCAQGNPVGFQEAAAKARRGGGGGELAGTGRVRGWGSTAWAGVTSQTSQDLSP